MENDDNRGKIAPEDLKAALKYYELLLGVLEAQLKSMKAVETLLARKNLTTDDVDLLKMYAEALVDTQKNLVKSVEIVVNSVYKHYN